ncbi:MAG: hypothetical protein KKG76_02665 [Euryarchaeota archaeon]|nr:hypothetical protein [Euryarchaeota archaeon]
MNVDTQRSILNMNVSNIRLRIVARVDLLMSLRDELEAGTHALAGGQQEVDGGIVGRMLRE